jgi:glycosyltransferase involved in cell wall biosynthesis
LSHITTVRGHAVGLPVVLLIVSRLKRNPDGQMKIGLIIASHGRPELLKQLLSSLNRQERRPDDIVLSVVNGEDLGSNFTADACSANIRVVYSNPGSCAQRNNGLAFLRDHADVVLFIDDDFWMSATYIRELERLFSENEHIVASTGLVLADGVAGPGISVVAAEKCIEDYARGPKPREIIKDVPDTYGCNMAFRVSKIGDIKFDERLPLYGWQEDVDFSAQFRGRGRIVWTNALWGVHLGTKKGKTSDVRFGYSQVINPLFICKKRNMSLPRAAFMICKNIAVNAAKSVRSEKYIDRRGRLKGNMIGLLHVISGRLDPMSALDL